MQSHATLALRGEICFDGHRLSLGGTSDVALMAYLNRNPNIERISLCLDNDDAGKMAANKIFATLAEPPFKHISVTIDLPVGSKDYNDILLQSVSLDKECNRSKLHQKDIHSL